MKILGIDPGLSGAIAVLEDTKVLGLFDMPVMADGKKNKRQLNSAQLVNIIIGVLGRTSDAHQI